MCWETQSASCKVSFIPSWRYKSTDALPQLNASSEALTSLTVSCSRFIRTRRCRRAIFLYWTNTFHPCLYLYTFDSSPAVVLFDVHVNLCVPDKTETKSKKNAEVDLKKNKRQQNWSFIQKFKRRVTLVSCTISFCFKKTVNQSCSRAFLPAAAWLQQQIQTTRGYIQNKHKEPIPGACRCGYLGKVANQEQALTLASH